jgi:diadenosine tetraphosphate (Ap4A) HIT family hydrolase
MLIRWASEKEILVLHYDTKQFKLYDVLVAVDRFSRNIIGHIGFNRDTHSICECICLGSSLEITIREKLTRCAHNQLDPKGGSFHYQFPRYAAQSIPSGCPCCNADPMPEGHIDIVELGHSWLTTLYEAQGCLFGKCHVMAKYHSIFLYDMPQNELTGFFTDVQLCARALHFVTESIKVNYEIHGNSAAHLHCHLFPRYLDDPFPSAPIEYRLTSPSPYESYAEFLWFVSEMKKCISGLKESDQH